MAWFCVFVYAVGHVLFDAVSGGANLLWPIHDQFYQFRGRLELSTQRGIVQTFVETGTSGGSGGGSGGSGGGGLPTPNAMGNSSEIQMDTAVDPDPSGTADGPVDRIFPVARGGWQLYLLVVGTLATASRFLVGHDLPEE